MAFISSYLPFGAHPEPSWWFLFKDGGLLVHITGNGAAQVPRTADPASLPFEPAATHYLGTLDAADCRAAALDKQASSLPEGMALVSLRKLFGMIPDEFFRIAVRAFEIIHWDETTRFCGRCGNPARLSPVERAKTCPSCELTVYPRISPAIIVAVVKERQLLLAQSRRFPKKFHSVLAGFVEPGETFEECVRREVKEEVNIDVTDIRYFDSQPWPFPDVMMVGFTARYAGGEIRADGEEVSEAGWFKPEDLPLSELPGKVSIARKLIDWFAENYK